jgi:hypothetical protein
MTPLPRFTAIQAQIQGRKLFSSDLPSINSLFEGKNGSTLPEFLIDVMRQHPRV